MNRFFLPLVCAVMVFLGTGNASAADQLWQCFGGWSAVEIKTGHKKAGNGHVKLRASSEELAIELAHTHFLDRLDRASFRDITSRVTRCEKTKEYVERKPYAPPIPAANTTKPTSRIWVCRVKTRWHVGARYGDIDETWSDVEAPSEAVAMGQAIFRTQSRAKALSLAGTNPTWSKTDVKCS